MNEKTFEQRAKRNKLIVIPLMVIAFCFCIWFIIKPSQESETVQQKGFNTEIPMPNSTNMTDDKRKAYEQENALKRENERKGTMKNLAEMFNRTKTSESVQESEPIETIVTSAEKYKEINSRISNFYDPPHNRESELSSEVEKLKVQLRETQQKQTSIDQVALMEKSYQLAAKYLPGGATNNGHETIEETIPTVPVTNVEDNTISSLGQTEENNIFFHTAVGENRPMKRSAIRAVINDTRKITDGQTVRLRLSDPMRVGGVLIDKNNIITGTAKINDERLMITVTSINNGGTILPVKMEVYDTDGNLGIFIPNSMEMNAVKEMASNMGSTLGTSISITQSAGQQLATDLAKGVIQGGSQYLSNKFKTVRVTLKAGYKVILLEKK